LQASCQVFVNLAVSSTAVAPVVQHLDLTAVIVVPSLCSALFGATQHCVVAYTSAYQLVTDIVVPSLCSALFGATQHCVGSLSSPSTRRRYFLITAVAPVVPQHSDLTAVVVVLSLCLALFGATQHCVGSLSSQALVNVASQ
jgi:hypothetical protein